MASQLNRLCVKRLFSKRNKTASLVFPDNISRNLVTIYRKYCNLIGYRTHYLSGDEKRLREENKQFNMATLSRFSGEVLIQKAVPEKTKIAKKKKKKNGNKIFKGKKKMNLKY